MFVRQFMERIGADTLHFLHYYDHMAQLQAFSLALPLGELSPKVTERALQALLNGNINLCTHAAKIPVDVSVGKSQNLQSKRCQKCGTLRIIGHPLRLIVLRTIQFNNQLGRSTIKVCDKSPDDSLFINLHRIFAEEKIPELSFVGVISLRNRRAFSSWLLSFGMVIFYPLSRLRRQLSQRESQVSLVTHYTRRCIEVRFYLFGIYKTNCSFIRIYKVCLSSSSNITSLFSA